MQIQIEKFITGPIETNTYVIMDENKHCFIVDPSSGCEEVLSYIKKNDLLPESIVITHCHFDHTIGISEIKEKYPHILVYVNPLEAVMLRRPEMNGSVMMGFEFTYTEPVIDLIEGPMEIGSFKVNIIVVPGHSPAGTAIYIDKYLLCGDILFAGSVGRSDLVGGDEIKLLTGIREKLLPLPDDTIVCPGHGGRTTIAREKRENPFLF